MTCCRSGRKDYDWWCCFPLFGGSDTTKSWSFPSTFTLYQLFNVRNHQYSLCFMETAGGAKYFFFLKMWKIKNRARGQTARQIYFFSLSVQLNLMQLSSFNSSVCLLSQVSELNLFSLSAGFKKITLTAVFFITITPINNHANSSGIFLRLFIRLCSSFCSFSFF